MQVLKRTSLVILMSIFLMAMVACGKNVSGTYIRQRSQRDYLQLRADGTFFLRERGNGMSGRYRIDDDVITLTMDGSGRATQGKIQRGGLIEVEGELWAKGDKPPAENADNVDPDILRRSQVGAANTIRSLTTLQATYSTTYPTVGYARSLSTLGTVGLSFCSASGHDQNQGWCQKDAILSCTKDWCPEGNYKYNLVGVQEQTRITDYVIVATPIDSQLGGHSYCSTSDAVLRYHSGEPISSMISVPECQLWLPL